MLRSFRPAKQWGLTPHQILLLMGADLLHLRVIEGITTGIASISGAGNFDGIVMPGIVAAYLA
jgi:uncharacterized membrane protein